jgi:hypothetical protein
MSARLAKIADAVNVIIACACLLAIGCGWLR